MATIGRIKSKWREGTQRWLIYNARCPTQHALDHTFSLATNFIILHSSLNVLFNFLIAGSKRLNWLKQMWTHSLTTLSSWETHIAWHWCNPSEMKAPTKTSDWIRWDSSSRSRLRTKAQARLSLRSDSWMSWRNQLTWLSWERWSASISKQLICTHKKV